MQNLEQYPSHRKYIAGVPCDFLSHEEYSRLVRNQLAFARTPSSLPAGRQASLLPIKGEGSSSANTFMHIVTLNAEMVVRAQHDVLFKQAIEQAELVIPDGSGILWAREYLDYGHSRLPAELAGEDGNLRGSPIMSGMTESLIRFLFSKHQPLTGVDSIFGICKELEQHHGTAYFLGGEEGDRKKTSEILKKKYPAIEVVVVDGLAEQSLQAISYKLKAKTSVIFVALGAPKQTFWIEQHRTELETAGVRIAMGVGGAFAMISGRLPRAPLFMRTLHLEWLWRLILEPSRIKRIWNAIVIFPRIISGYPH